MADTPELNAAHKQLLEELNAKFAISALEASALPVACSRFQLVTLDEGQTGVLVLGGGIAAQHGAGNTPLVYTQVLAAALINRIFAAELAVQLEHILKLTPDELKSAEARLYPVADAAPI